MLEPTPSREAKKRAERDSQRAEPLPGGRCQSCCQSSLMEPFLPATAGLWAELCLGRCLLGQMQAAPRDGGERATKVETTGEFVGEPFGPETFGEIRSSPLMAEGQGEVQRTAVREEVPGEIGAIARPRRGVIAAAEPRGKDGPTIESAMTPGEEPRDKGERQAVVELLFIHRADTAPQSEDSAHRKKRGISHPILCARRALHAGFAGHHSKPSSSAVRTLPRSTPPGSRDQSL